MTKIITESYVPEFTNINALVSFYEHDTDTVIEMIQDGKIINTTLNDFELEDLKEMRARFDKVIKQKQK
jgi:hypothetical protein